MEKNYIITKDELINSNGEGPIMNQNEIFDYYEDKQIEEIAIEDIENTIERAQEILSAYSEEMRIVMDNIASEGNRVYELMESDNIIESEDATYDIVGSGFAGAATNEKESIDPSAWKLLLTGVSRGAKVATLALAMALPLATQAKDKPKDHHDDKIELTQEGNTSSKHHKKLEVAYEDPRITSMVDDIFGKDVIERLGGKRDSYKALYAKLEAQKRELQAQLKDGDEIVPRSAEEAAEFAFIESTRDSELAAIHLQEVKYNSEVMRLNLKDEVSVAAAQAQRAYFKTLKANVIRNFEAKILKAHNMRNSGHENDATRIIIRRIENQQNDLEQRQLRLSNRSHY